MMKRFATVLLVLGCLGGATDAYAVEAPASAPLPAVGVVGVASVPISPTASQAEANAAYRQGLAAAIGDGHEKAQFLATQTGANVGAIQQIVEHGGSIECVVHAKEGSLTQYEPYEGAQPDFGSVESSGTRIVAAPETSRKAIAKTTPARKKKKHKAKAKKAATSASCTLFAQVGLSYLLT
jgi:hypothetical protein